MACTTGMFRHTSGVLLSDNTLRVPKNPQAMDSTASSWHWTQCRPALGLGNLVLAFTALHKQLHCTAHQYLCLTGQIMSAVECRLMGLSQANTGTCSVMRAASVGVCRGERAAAESSKHKNTPRQVTHMTIRMTARLASEANPTPHDQKHQVLLLAHPATWPYVYIANPSHPVTNGELQLIVASADSCLDHEDRNARLCCLQQPPK